MIADLTAADGSAAVIVSYVLRAADGGLLPAGSPIDFELLGFGEATTDRFVAWGTTPVLLWEMVGSHRAAAISAPSTEDDALLIELSYSIERAVEEDEGRLHVRVPVLNGPSAPDPGSGGGFEARLLLPPGWDLSEGFPSGLRPAGPTGVWAVSLPVVPAMVGFRGSSDGSRRLGLPVVIDLLMLLALGGFAVVGWRHLSGLAREARA